MRYDQEHKARTRQKVLKEASEAIRGAGVDGVGVAGIMARAGLTQGAFYAHFKSKDHLVAEAVGYMFEERYGHMLDRLTSSQPKKILADFIDFYLSTRHRDLPQVGCPIPPLVGAGRLPKAARKRFAEGTSRLLASLTVLLGRVGIADPELTANSMLAELVGALNLARSIDDREQADELLAASRASLKRRLGVDDL